MNILSICGSPRKGNSEAIINKISEILSEKGIENEIVLLREKRIERCRGCVEFCNKELLCHIEDDMAEIMAKMEKADGMVFVSPNYFNMPTGLFKDFIDRCCVIYDTPGKLLEFRQKKAVVICVGAGEAIATDICTNNIVNNFCQILEMQVVGQKSFKANSELKGNYNDIFENGLNPNLEKELKELVEGL